MKFELGNDTIKSNNDGKRNFIDGAGIHAEEEVNIAWPFVDKQSMHVEHITTPGCFLSLSPTL